MLLENKGQSANVVWRKMLSNIVTNGNEVKPRNLRCLEILSHTSVVNMSHSVTTLRPKFGKRFLFAEAYFILTGKNTAASISKFSPHISSFANDFGYFDGSYGLKILDQISYVAEALVKDNDTRQAVLTIWRENPRPSKDIPCTVAIQWVLRQDRNANGEECLRLDCFDFMRSSDAWLGWPYDVFNFSMLSSYLLLLIREKLPLPVELGDLYLTASSQHIYIDPIADGATNIPYSLKDVTAVLFSKPKSTVEPISYSGLDLSYFNSAAEFLEYIKVMRDYAEKDNPSWPFYVNLPENLVIK